MVGCGNSELSEQLHDVGYKHLTNIDISETVVSHMNQRNAERRPDLKFQQVDATQMPYQDACYQAALDKGTLDAMASEEGGDLARNMLTEVQKKANHSMCRLSGVIINPNTRQHSVSVHLRIYL